MSKFDQFEQHYSLEPGVAISTRFWTTYGVAILEILTTQGKGDLQLGEESFHISKEGSQVFANNSLIFEEK